MSKTALTRNVLKSLGAVLALSLGISGTSFAQTFTLEPVHSYSYSVKFVCGAAQDTEGRATVRPGIYGTEINIHNYHLARLQQANVRKRVWLLVRDSEPVGREPEFVKVDGTDSIQLPPSTATMDDCQRISEITNANTSVLTIGFLQILSDRPLAVDAVYTTSGFDDQTVTSIDVERVEERRVDSRLSLN